MKILKVSRTFNIVKGGGVIYRMMDCVSVTEKLFWEGEYVGKMEK